MSVFVKLKRRNGIRMAGLYFVGSWLVVPTELASV